MRTAFFDDFKGTEKYRAQNFVKLSSKLVLINVYIASYVIMGFPKTKEEQKDHAKKLYLKREKNIILPVLMHQVVNT